MLAQKIEEKKKQRVEFTTMPSSVFRVFEIYEESKKDESGKEPIIVKEVAKNIEKRR